MADIHVSFDLETLHTRADGVILSVAAAARVDGVLTTFYAPVNIESQLERMISEDTLAWWQKKGDLWQQTLNQSQEADSLYVVLTKLATWYTNLGTDRDRLFPWGNGANFDIAFLEHAFDEEKVACPWSYWTGRDLRTLKHLAQELGVFENVEREGTHHTALDDAVSQLNMIETWWAAVTGLKEAA